MAELVNSTSSTRGGGTPAERIKRKVDVSVVHQVRRPPLVLRTGINYGRGHSLVSLFIAPSDFRALVDAMIEADRDVALEALSAALAEELRVPEEGAMARSW